MERRNSTACDQTGLVVDMAPPFKKHLIEFIRVLESPREPFKPWGQGLFSIPLREDVFDGLADRLGDQFLQPVGRPQVFKHATDRRMRDVGLARYVGRPNTGPHQFDSPIKRFHVSLLFLRCGWFDF